MSLAAGIGASSRTPGSGRRALAACALDPLLIGAARLRGDRLALSASGEGVAERSLTFAEMDAIARRIAGALAECGLAPGESLIIVGAADPDTVLLLLGAARAGVVAALAPAGAEPARLAAMARAVSAAAVAGPARIGALDLGPTLLRVAAEVETIRFVGCAGGESDGAVRLDDEGFAPAAQRVAAAPVVTFHDGPDGPAPVRHEQTTLAAAALDFLARSQIGAGLPLVSTMSPTRFAGLVAGPVASLLSGAPLHLHAPFETAALVAAMADRRAAHLVAPLRLGEDLARLARAEKLKIATIVLVRDEAQAAPDPLDADSPIVDLVRIGEIAAIAERRDELGGAAPFPGPPHSFPLDEEELVACEWRLARDGALEWRGVAVSGGEDFTRA